MHPNLSGGGLLPRVTNVIAVWLCRGGVPCRVCVVLCLLRYFDRYERHFLQTRQMNADERQMHTERQLQTSLGAKRTAKNSLRQRNSHVRQSLPFVNRVSYVSQRLHTHLCGGGEQPLAEAVSFGRETQISACSQARDLWSAPHFCFHYIPSAPSEVRGWSTSTPSSNWWVASASPGALRDHVPRVHFITHP